VPSPAPPPARGRPIAAGPSQTFSASISLGGQGKGISSVSSVFKPAPAPASAPASTPTSAPAPASRRSSATTSSGKLGSKLQEKEEEVCEEEEEAEAGERSLTSGKKKNEAEEKQKKQKKKKKKKKVATSGKAEASTAPIGGFVGVVANNDGIGVGGGSGGLTDGKKFSNSASAPAPPIDTSATDALQAVLDEVINGPASTFSVGDIMQEGDGAGKAGDAGSAATKATLRRTFLLLGVFALVGAGTGLPIGCLIGVTLRPSTALGISNLVLALIVGASVGAGIGATFALYTANRCCQCIYACDMGLIKGEDMLRDSDAADGDGSNEVGDGVEETELSF